jgi:hypothetical protein
MIIAYVQNRSPHRILKNLTPEEAFSRKKPSIEHLRIFGCPIYIHVPKDKRKKLETSRKRGIFVGYSESSKVYRIYVPGQQKIEISRDVTFEERIEFRKSIEEPIESNEEEEHEDTKEESTCSPEQSNEEQEPPMNLWNQLLYLRQEKYHHGLKLLCRKQKSIRLPLVGALCFSASCKVVSSMMRLTSIVSKLS